MNELTKQNLLNKNQKLTDMVIEKAKRDFPDDIALIGLSGSFSTNDFHEKSDLDLIIVNNTGAGWEISDCFILDDVGYDIYCTPWKILEEMANLESYWTSLLTEMQILYVADEKYLEKLNNLKEKALKTLSQPVGEESIRRAEKYLNLAKQAYADTMISDKIGAIRYASSELVFHVVNGIVGLNNTYIKRGVKRYLEDLALYEHLPENFEKLYMEIVEAKTKAKIRQKSLTFLQSFIQLYEHMKEEHQRKTTPTIDNLKGSYEELWCNIRNKLINSTTLGDKSYAFLVANDGQSYFDEMTDYYGTPKFDLMKHFDADNLDNFREKFLEMMEAYRMEYDKVGCEVRKFDDFEALYESYMKS